jgi:two-component system OmpR family sensor kinase
MQIYVLVSFGSMVLVAAFTWIIAGRMLRPIEWLREAAESIGEDDLTTRVPVTGSDDLTRLTVTINGMLDRISESVDAQRRLLDDVGHELRTPVTVVRGHLELMDAHDPEDVTATQVLALDELDRMGGLVTDLLTLAGSDRADFVQQGWVDLAELTDTTLEKARALGSHRWRLSEVADHPAWLDGARITQAWLQLAANASKYSEPGTVIEFGSRVVDDEVWLWVRDEGIGIEPADITLIQDRFGRAQAGRLHAEGAGLGLSIVGSIVAAHAGRLDIDSTPGVGSRFTMVLPLATEQEESDEHDPDH